MCHSIAGKGNSKGSLDKVGGQFKPDEIRQWIVNSKEMAAKHDAQRKPPMKDFSGLPKGDVDALVAYLQTAQVAEFDLRACRRDVPLQGIVRAMA